MGRSKSRSRSRPRYSVRYRSRSRSFSPRRKSPPRESFNRRHQSQTRRSRTPPSPYRRTPPPRRKYSPGPPGKDPYNERYQVLPGGSSQNRYPPHDKRPEDRYFEDIRYRGEPRHRDDTRHSNDPRYSDRRDSRYYEYSQGDRKKIAEDRHREGISSPPPPSFDRRSRSWSTSPPRPPPFPPRWPPREQSYGDYHPTDYQPRRSRSPHENTRVKPRSRSPVDRENKENWGRNQKEQERHTFDRRGDRRLSPERDIADRVRPSRDSRRPRNSSECIKDVRSENQKERKSKEKDSKLKHKVDKSKEKEKGEKKEKHKHKKRHKSQGSSGEHDKMENVEKVNENDTKPGPGSNDLKVEEIVATKIPTVVSIPVNKYIKPISLHNLDSWDWMPADDGLKQNSEEGGQVESEHSSNVTVIPVTEHIDMRPEMHCVEMSDTKEEVSEIDSRRKSINLFDTMEALLKEEKQEVPAAENVSEKTNEPEAQPTLQDTVAIKEEPPSGKDSIEQIDVPTTEAEKSQDGSETPKVPNATEVLKETEMAGQATTREDEINKNLTEKMVTEEKHDAKEDTVDTEKAKQVTPQVQSTTNETKPAINKEKLKTKELSKKERKELKKKKKREKKEKKKKHAIVEYESTASDAGGTTEADKPPASSDETPCGKSPALVAPVPEVSKWEREDDDVEKSTPATPTVPRSKASIPTSVIEQAEKYLSQKPRISSSIVVKTSKFSDKRKVFSTEKSYVGSPEKLERQSEKREYSSHREGCRSSERREVEHHREVSDRGRRPDWDSWRQEPEWDSHRLERDTRRVEQRRTSPVRFPSPGKWRRNEVNRVNVERKRSRGRSDRDNEITRATGKESDRRRRDSEKLSHVSKEKFSHRDKEEKPRRLDEKDFLGNSKEVPKHKKGEKQRSESKPDVEHAKKEDRDKKKYKSGDRKEKREKSEKRNEREQSSSQDEFSSTKLHQDSGSKREKTERKERKESPDRRFSNLVDEANFVPDYGESSDDSDSPVSSGSGEPPPPGVSPLHSVKISSGRTKSPSSVRHKRSPIRFPNALTSGKVKQIHLSESNNQKIVSKKRKTRSASESSSESTSSTPRKKVKPVSSSSESESEEEEKKKKKKHKRKGKKEKREKSKKKKLKKKKKQKK